MKPAYLRISPINLDGASTHRLMVVLKTKGCEYAKKTGGCTVCGFLNNASEHIDEKHMLSQLDYVLENVDLAGVRAIDLLTLGSFYNRNEVNGNFRKTALQKIAGLANIERVSVESRAEYVTAGKLRESKEILGDKTIEFGIGLESADDYVRNEIIKKDLSKETFVEVVKMLKNVGCRLLVYLLIKPPYLSEKRAVEDAVKSAEYVFAVAGQQGVRARVAFEPVFICQDTPLEELFQKAEYRLVNLWSVVEIIKRTHSLGSIFVGLSDENLSNDRMTDSCRKCKRKIIEEIEGFNSTQDISRLEKLYCECREDYEYKLETGQI